jgi:hypothetical protein
MTATLLSSTVSTAPPEAMQPELAFAPSALSPDLWPVLNAVGTLLHRLPLEDP